MTNVKSAPDYFLLNRRIQCQGGQYLGELISEEDFKNNKVLNEMTRKVDITYAEMLTKRNLYINAKLRNYNTVIRPDML